MTKNIFRNTSFLIGAGFIILLGILLFFSLIQGRKEKKEFYIRQGIHQLYLGLQSRETGLKKALKNFKKAAKLSFWDRYPYFLLQRTEKLAELKNPRRDEAKDPFIALDRELFFRNFMELKSQIEKETGFIKHFGPAEMEMFRRVKKYYLRLLSELAENRKLEKD